MEKKSNPSPLKKSLPKKSKQSKHDEKKKQPISSQRIWFTAANLNLSGIGYFLSGHKKRGVIFMGGGIILLLAAQFSNASRNPTMWGLAFLAFFIAMAVDLWLLLKITPAKLPKLLQKSTTLLPVVSILINVLFYGGFFLYRWAGSNIYQNGLLAYEQADYSTAFGNWYSLTNYYRLTLNSQVTAVQDQLEETSLILTSRNQVTAGEYEEAFATIDKFIQLYPDSPNTSAVESSGLDACFGWARDLAGQDDYEGGLKKIREGQSRFADEAQTRQAGIDAAYAEHYLAWGQYLSGEEDFNTAIQKFEFISRSYPQSAEYQTAYEDSAQAYLDWAQQLGKEKSYGSAAQKLDKIINSYAKSDVVDEAKLQLPDAYLLWGLELREVKQYLQALQKFDAIKKLTNSKTTLASTEKEYEHTITLLAKDSGEDGEQVIEEARIIACEEEIPTHPAVDLLVDEPGKMRACGSSQTWIPDALKATIPGNFRYIAVRNPDSRRVQSCPYTGGHTLYRYQYYYEVKVLLVTTGGVAAEKTFYGSLPVSCPAIHQFYGTTDEIYGDFPTKEQFADWLEEVIQ